MTRLDTEPPVQLEGDPGHRVRVVYRDGSGAIHLDWPAACILGPRREVLNRPARDELSAISNRTHEIMKTLTLVMVMFMPMSFLAGFLGMNFFGEPLEFKSWLPKDTLFAVVRLVTVLTPAVM
jgi:hypothetical protein